MKVKGDSSFVVRQKRGKSLVQSGKYRVRIRHLDLAICRLSPTSPLPQWAIEGQLWSLTRTPTELSIVCRASDLPGSVPAERNWCALEVVGPLSFAMVGVLSALLAPLAADGISVFVLSTFETDWILVRKENVEAACKCLLRAGHTLVREEHG